MKMNFCDSTKIYESSFTPFRNLHNDKNNLDSISH